MYAAKIISGAVAATYATPHEVRMAHPATAFPQSMAAADLAAVQCVLVAPTAAPTHSPLTHRAAEIAPVFSSGEWVQAWALEPLSPEEQAQVEAELIAQFSAAAQTRLDEWARTRNYDGILSLCTYATSTVPQFASEGQRGVDLRDATWAALYAILAQVEAGTRPLPASFAAIEGELPVLTWGGE